MKNYEKPKITLIVAENEDIVTASVYVTDNYNDGWKGPVFEEVQ